MPILSRHALLLFPYQEPLRSLDRLLIRLLRNLVPAFLIQHFSPALIRVRITACDPRRYRSGSAAMGKDGDCLLWCILHTTTCCLSKHRCTVSHRLRPKSCTATIAFALSFRPRRFSRMVVCGPMTCTSTAVGAETHALPSTAIHSAGDASQSFMFHFLTFLQGGCLGLTPPQHVPSICTRPHLESILRHSSPKSTAITLLPAVNRKHNCI